MDNMENVEVKGNPEDFFLSRVYTEIMEEDLVVPGVSDYQIIDYVRDSIVLKDINYSGCFVPSPLLVQKNIALSSIKNAYGIEASDLAKTLLNNIEIRKTGNKHEYHINSISNEPVSMTVPSTTNTLSHIYIARDAIEGIKNVNKSEYSLKYKCGNVITIFHELMEAFNNNDKKCDFIINRRLATLKGECIEDMEEIYDASNYDCDHTRAVLLQNNVDILSFYYAARLFNVYLKRPYDVLSKIKEVILGQTNTQNLLNYYGLLEEVDFEDYEKAVLRLQNKTLR